MHDVLVLAKVMHVHEVLPGFPVQLLDVAPREAPRGVEQVQAHVGPHEAASPPDRLGDLLLPRAVLHRGRLVAEGVVRAHSVVRVAPAVEVGHDPGVVVVLQARVRPGGAVRRRDVHAGLVLDVDDELDVGDHAGVGEGNDGAVY